MNKSTRLNMPSATSDNSLVNRAALAVRQHASQRDQDLLLAVLQCAPNERGRANVANKILHCGDAYKEAKKLDSCHFAQLADFFWRNIIVPGAWSAVYIDFVADVCVQCECPEVKRLNLGVEDLRVALPPRTRYALPEGWQLSTLSKAS